MYSLVTAIQLFKGPLRLALLAIDKRIIKVDCGIALSLKEFVKIEEAKHVIGRLMHRFPKINSKAVFQPQVRF